MINNDINMFIQNNKTTKLKRQHVYLKKKTINKRKPQKKKEKTRTRRWKASSVSGVGDGLTTPSEASVFWSLPRTEINS